MGENPGGSRSNYENARTTGKEQFRSVQSLGLITQRFMSLRHKNEIMNLNEVSNDLGIPKRRVYDVINVLEGLGYVEKAEKNNIKWIGDGGKSSAQQAMESEVEQLRQQEKILEQMLHDAQSTLKLHFEDPISRPYNYVQKADIRQASSPESKSIIIKSEVDAKSVFEIQMTDPASLEGTYEMIVRNKKGVKSYALLFTNEIAGTSVNHHSPLMDQKDPCLTLASTSSDPTLEARIKEEEIDIDDLETFVIPSSTLSSTSAPYAPETPGRGLLISPFKSLIDPTCILPSFSEDHGYIHIATPNDNPRISPTSLESTYFMDTFSD